MLCKHGSYKTRVKLKSDGALKHIQMGCVLCVMEAHRKTLDEGDKERGVINFPDINEKIESYCARYGMDVGWWDTEYVGVWGKYVNSNPNA